MRHLLFFVMFVPVLLQAQNNERYLAGAVPVENNKVIFSTEINVPHLSKDEIYDKALTWAQDRFNGEDSRVVFMDKAKGEIAVVGKEYIIFSTSALSLDRSYMSFLTKLECSDQKCLIQLTNIRYEYTVSYQKEPEKYLAEEWITDEWALSKKNKLNRANGKFRKATIDFADEMLQNLTSALASQTITNATSQNSITIVQAPSTTNIVATTPKQEKAHLDSLVPLDVNNIPQTILQMLSESSIKITMNINETPLDTKVVWKGSGNMFGKSIASVSIEENSPAYKLITTNNTYTILFAKNDNSKTPWLIMNCRKQGETSDGSQKTILGEILRIWIK